MTDEPSQEARTPRGGPGASSGDVARPGTPRWVKALAIIGIVLVLLFIAVQLATGGDHGPGRHPSLGTTSPISSTGAARPAPSGEGPT